MALLAETMTTIAVTAPTAAPQPARLPSSNIALPSAPDVGPATDTLRCVVCRRPFAFASGDAALVLRHTAYGYDFVHDGPCLATAQEWLFLEPGYDRAAFGRDPERRRILEASPATGWSAVLANADQGLAGQAARLEPLRWWVLVEHRDGTQRVEGLVRDDEWLDEPGGAEFPEAASGGHGWLGYTAPPS
jgi:hypothetical protein